jgi:hypothetical protein
MHLVKLGTEGTPNSHRRKRQILTRCLCGLSVDLTLLLSFRQGDGGGLAKSFRWPVHSRGLFEVALSSGKLSQISGVSATYTYLCYESAESLTQNTVTVPICKMLIGGVRPSD